MLDNNLIKLFTPISINESIDFTLIKSIDSSFNPSPFILSKTLTEKKAWIVSSVHGRSIVVSKSKSLYTVLKGAGLTYTDKLFVNISEYKYRHIWGYLSKSDALREYQIGTLFFQLGGKGPQYESIVKIGDFDQKKIVGLKKINPYLLQYKINCPIRVSDFGLFERNKIIEYLNYNNRNKNVPLHISFAETCIQNLLILHNNSIFYNALNVYNTSLLGEFVDFECSFTNKLYCPKEGFAIYEKLMAREIINLFQVVSVFCDLLKEKIDYSGIKALIEVHYLNKLQNKVVKKNLPKFYQLING